MKRTDITKLFPDATDEQIKTLMDINGNDINSAKSGVDELRGQLAAANAELAKKANAVEASELAKAQERAEAAEKELNTLKLSNQLREMRETVSKAKGVPADLLTGETEDACNAQADGILAFAKPNGYPALRDAGEVSGAALGGSARDHFIAWGNENLKK